MTDHTGHLRMDRLRRSGFSRLFMRIFLVTFLTLALILAVLQTYSYLQTRYLLDRELDSANLRRLSSIREAADTVRRQMQTQIMQISVDTDIRTFLRNTAPDAYSYPDVENRINIVKKMESWISASPIDSILVYNSAADRVVASSYGGAFLMHYEDKKAVETLADMRISPTQNLFFRQSRITSNTETPCLALAIRLNSRNMGFGYIVLYIQEDHLRQMIREKLVDDVSEVLLIDENDTILLDTHARYAGQTLAALNLTPEQEERIHTTDSKAFNTRTDGSMMRFSWVRSLSDGMIYLQMMPYNHYATLLVHLVRTTLVSLALGTLVALAASWVLARYAHKPIRSLTSAITDPPSDTEGLDCDEETGYILMKLLLANDKNVRLERENLQQFEALKRAQANVLQAQITPHFLYNTLQAIQMMVMMETGKTKSPATEALLALSGITRTLLQKKEDTVTLEEEVRYLEQYVYLKKLSYPDTLRVEVDIPPEALECSVPKISLQPLVENVIMHGMPEGCVCRIEIRARKENGTLTVSVDDNGPGMDEEQIRTFNQASGQDVVLRNQQVGLINLAQRLKLLWGDGASLRLSASALGGLRVEFRLPVQEIRRAQRE